MAGGIEHIQKAYLSGKLELLSLNPKVSGPVKIRCSRAYQDMVFQNPQWWRQKIKLDGLPVYTSSLVIITPPPCSPIFLLFLLFSSFSTATLLNPVVVEVVSIVSGGDRLDGVCGVATGRSITQCSSISRYPIRCPSTLWIERVFTALKSSSRLRYFLPIRIQRGTVVGSPRSALFCRHWHFWR